ncbi:MAG: cytochrome c maturation protein CcmE, partial [Anaerohalosphaera sp.]|nr:cytochrome c maturation protein CcmE [Anaerohalosphaera sp.]
MKSKAIAKALIGIVVIGGGIGYFMVQAVKSSSSYSYTVDEFLDGDDAAMINSIRLAGGVKAGSVSKDVEQMLLSFVLEGGKSELP